MPHLTRLAPALLLAIALAALLPGCQSPRAVAPPEVGPLGRTFPSVSGRALDGTALRVPEDLAGQPAVVIVGYVQGAQRDIDRWLKALAARETPARVLELPTIPSRFWSGFAGMIDGGMRGGIQRAQWGNVMTLWGAAADPVVAFLGNRDPLLGRVLLLDRAGRVVWFHDRGFDDARLDELDRLARTL